MQRIPDGSIDMVLTSPPYDTMRLYGGIAKEWTFDKFKDIAAELVRVLKIGGAIIWVVGDETIKHSETGTSFRQALHFMDLGLKLQDTMIFEKKNPLPGRKPTSYGQAFEYMFVLTKNVLKTFNPIMVDTVTRKTVYNKVNKWSRENGKTTSGPKTKMTNSKRTHYNIFKYAVGNRQGGEFHPAVFPLQLPIDMVFTYSNEGDIILDPFMGSATTAIACIRENRNFIGFELNREYYEKSIKRIELEKQQLKLF